MAAVAGPFVKAADLLVGERVAMRIDADLRPADDGARAHTLCARCEPSLRVGAAAAGALFSPASASPAGEGAKPTKQLSSLFVHKRLSVSVGNSVAAFARAAIEGGGKAGGAPSSREPTALLVFTRTGRWSSSAPLPRPGTAFL